MVTDEGMVVTASLMKVLIVHLHINLPKGLPIQLVEVQYSMCIAVLIPTATSCMKFNEIEGG